MRVSLRGLFFFSLIVLIVPYFVQASVAGTLQEGETQTYSVDGVDHEIVLVSLPDSDPAEATFIIGEELTSPLRIGGTYVLNNLYLHVVDIQPGREGHADFTLENRYPCPNCEDIDDMETQHRTFDGETYSIQFLAVGDECTFWVWVGTGDMEDTAERERSDELASGGSYEFVTLPLTLTIGECQPDGERTAVYILVEGGGDEPDSSCQNECENHQERWCVGNKVYSCVFANGCWEEGIQETCKNNELCEEGQCVAHESNVEVLESFSFKEWVKGEKTAPHTITAFLDLQDSDSRDFYEQIMPLIEREFLDSRKAHLMVKDYPSPTDSDAYDVARAAECFGFIGGSAMYYESVATLLYNQEDYSDHMLIDIAQGFFSGESETNFAQYMDAWNLCFDYQMSEDQVDKDIANGSQRGVTSAPAVFFDSQPIENPLVWSSYEGVLEETADEEICQDECDWKGRGCYQNSVARCWDRDGDGCKELEIKESCDDGERCYAAVDAAHCEPDAGCHVSNGFPVEPGKKGYCSESCTCSVGEGDCDYDSDCGEGLSCVYNAQYADNNGIKHRTDLCLERHTPDGSSEDYPVVLVHGHAPYVDEAEERNQIFFTQGDFETFQTFIDHLDSDGLYLDKGFVLPSDARLCERSGDWGSKRVAVRTTYYLEQDENNYLISDNTQNIETYAGRLKTVVDEVKRCTGSDKVTIIAHSMGGLVSRKYVQENPNSVNKLFTIGTPNNGIDYAEICSCALSLQECLSGNAECIDMDENSEFIEDLNSHDIAVPTITISGKTSFSILGDDGVVDVDSVRLEGAENLGPISCSHSDLIDPVSCSDSYNYVTDRLTNQNAINDVKTIDSSSDEPADQGFFKSAGNFVKKIFSFFF